MQADKLFRKIEELLNEYRYQDTKTKQPIYVIGSDYYTVSKKYPKDTEYDWKQFKDQFWAKKSDTIMWEAKAE